ncbi:hypothetical protein V2A60_003830 [Cordyceps javanica]|uniref:Aminoglycoside phosphotransferase domain-containing protein n=1 Tax=Cordyceps javanica TaxID=43265 RepID=A0A545VSR2_9HYPO|nr:hypothetical protein IF1G_08165 [Cordyceps javanica]TQW04761.1 hypothetical protein IF2G_07404 [Cordyceps javanica]
MLSSESTNKIMIALFFRERPTPTQKECDEFVHKITQSTPDLDLLQGGSSYTVLAGDSYIVHFRKPTGRLDRELLRQARETYGEYVPEFVEEHKLGDLWVYKITRMHGVPVYTIRVNLSGEIDESPLCRTVRDFARFCAAGWKTRPANLPPPRETLQDEYLTALEKISRLLPDRFQAGVRLAQDAVPRLFDGDWPMVINNGNLMRPNMLVRDASSGALAGLVAWSTAEVSPWGMMVPAIETILGHTNYEGTWTRIDGYDRLRRLFHDELDRELGWRAPDSRLDGVYVLGLLLQKTPHSLGSCWQALEGVLPDGHLAVSFLTSALLDY